MNLKIKKLTAVILAGETEQNLLADPTITNRAMIPLVGKTVLQWVVDALLEQIVVGPVVAVGNVQADGLDNIISPPGGSFLSSLMAGMEAVESGARVLLLTCDIPLLTGKIVADFVARAREADADIVFPVVAKALCERKYPELRRTYVRVNEGMFTMGNMALLNVDFVRRNRALIEDAFAARKSPLRMAGMVGFGLILRLMLAKLGVPGTISIHGIEQAASRVLGGRLAVIQSEYPEIAEDMDHPGDLEIMQRIFERNVETIR